MCLHYKIIFVVCSNAELFLDKVISSNNGDESPRGCSDLSQSTAKLIYDTVCIVLLTV